MYWVIFVMYYLLHQKIACERMHSMPFAKFGHNDQLTEYYFVMKATTYTYGNK